MDKYFEFKHSVGIKIIKLRPRFAARIVENAIKKDPIFYKYIIVIFCL